MFCRYTVQTFLINVYTVTSLDIVPYVICLKNIQYLSCLYFSILIEQLLGLRLQKFKAGYKHDVANCPCIRNYRWRSKVDIVIAGINVLIVYPPDHDRVKLQVPRVQPPHHSWQSALHVLHVFHFESNCCALIKDNTINHNESDLYRPEIEPAPPDPLSNANRA